MIELARRVDKLTTILEVAKAMTEERSLDHLLELVCSSATHIVEAERTTLYVRDIDRHELWSRVAEGTGEIRFPDSAGLAGAVATMGRAINIPDAYQDERFNRAVDLRTGFRTKALLTVPMNNTRGEVVGVLQTLNKRDGTTFDANDESLLLALAGVAAAALSNVLLHEEIERLFDGFANAAVVAIESRDPSTAGHSGRVAQLSLNLADAIERAGNRWQSASLSKDERRELRFAALLHDFGKVGVREAVLVKANKLYPENLEAIEARFETIRRTRQLESAQRQAALERRRGWRARAAIAEEQARLRHELTQLEEMLAFVRKANIPTPLPEGSFERLGDIAKLGFTQTSGLVQPYLSEKEVKLLSIRRGTLGEEERAEIESHVTHTYRFLSQIPWTRSLRRVPELAYGHHEKLSGRGYPRGLGETGIPPQTRIISICDIYDALTAADRPYKKAIPHARALDILHDEAKSGSIDPDLLQLFIEADVPNRRAS